MGRAKYKGAYGLQPVTGFHRDVTVLDFASMYPSIMIGANFSPETVYRITDPDLREALIDQHKLVRPQEDRDVVILWDDEYVFMRSSDVIFAIDRTRAGIAHITCKELIARRRSLPEKNGPEGWTLKIGTNSIYGVFGASTSGLSCKLAAVAVTAMGRFLLSNLIRLAKEHNFEVLYGDTDSIKRSQETICTEEAFLNFYHAWSKNTPFEAVKLEHDKAYSELILIKPKIYYGRLLQQSQPIMKGMASKRRDRPDIARHALRRICDAICNSSDDDDMFRLASTVIYDVVCHMRKGDLDPLICRER